MKIEPYILYTIYYYNIKDTYLGPIPNSQHVFEEHHVPRTEAAASDAFGGELADAGAFLADVGCNLAGCTVMGLIVMKSS